MSVLKAPASDGAAGVVSKPMPLVPADQPESIKSWAIQFVPRSLLVGIMNLSGAPGARSTLGADTVGKPYETLSTWGGNVGEKAEAIVMPSGLTRARYSPSEFSLKFVCSGWPGVRRFFSEAKMTMKAPPLMLVAETPFVQVARLVGQPPAIEVYRD